MRECPLLKRSGRVFVWTDWGIDGREGGVDGCVNGAEGQTGPVGRGDPAEPRTTRKGQPLGDRVRCNTVDSPKCWPVMGRGWHEILCLNSTWQTEGAVGWTCAATKLIRLAFPNSIVNARLRPPAHPCLCLFFSSLPIPPNQPLGLIIMNLVLHVGVLTLDQPPAMV